MQLLCLSRYRTAYVGLIEREHTYEWFKITRKGRLSRLKVYEKKDFEDLNHFKSILAKFVSSRNFFSAPLVLEHCTIEALDNIAGNSDLTADRKRVRE